MNEFERLPGTNHTCAACADAIYWIDGKKAVRIEQAAYYQHRTERVILCGDCAAEILTEESQAETAEAAA